VQAAAVFIAAHKCEHCDSRPQILPPFFLPTFPSYGCWWVGDKQCVAIGGGASRLELVGKAKGLLDPPSLRLRGAMARGGQSDRQSECEVVCQKSMPPRAMETLPSLFPLEARVLASARPGGMAFWTGYARFEMPEIHSPHPMKRNGPPGWPDGWPASFPTAPAQSEGWRGASRSYASSCGSTCNPKHRNGIAAATECDHEETPN